MRMLPLVVACALAVGCHAPFYVGDGATRPLFAQEKLTDALKEAFTGAENAGKLNALARLKNARVLILMRDLARVGPRSGDARVVENYVRSALVGVASPVVVFEETGEEDTVLLVTVDRFGVEAVESGFPFLFMPLFWWCRYRAEVEVTFFAYRRADGSSCFPAFTVKGKKEWSKFLVLGFGPL